MTVFTDAVKRGDVYAVHSLLDEKARAAFDENEVSNALCQAAFSGNLEMVTLLITKMRINRNTLSDALNCAIENIQLKMVEYLLRGGADVNVSDEFGQTPLHKAIDIEAEDALYQQEQDSLQHIASSDITALLIEHGANINAKTKMNETPLQWAINRHHHRAESLLKQHGV